MEKDHLSPYTKISMNIRRELLDKAKFAALYTRSSVSEIMRIALKEKLDKLKEQIKDSYSRENNLT